MTKLTSANANPTKAFFVRTITKDISLEDCILDLIDNSVDGAWKAEGGHPIGLADQHNLSKYKITIEASEKRFRIQDNCAGITLNDAVEYAFTFGRRPDEPQDDYSIGVYGIGMKRAIFKMGNDIRIRSSYSHEGQRESFLVPINVAKWLKADDSANWDFDIETAKDLAENGVEIIVNELNESTSTYFGNPKFLQNLRRVIGRDYALHLHRGLVIELNGERVQGWQIEMLQGGSFEPMRVQYTDESNGGQVTVEIFAGMSAPPPDDSAPDTSVDGENRSGWYIVCNGRIVLAADQTTITGWGTENWPKWHPQYAGFIGFVLFSSSAAGLLPLTTTKRNVDASSAVYRRALPKMREASRQWIDYTNRRKQTIEEAKQFESATKPLSFYKVAPRAAVALPQLTPKPKEKIANIAYSMPLARVKDLAREFGNINMSYRDVGIESFNYAYSEHVGDD